MGVNDELDKGNKLLRDQTELVGVLDNAFKSIAANISNAIDTIIDELQGVDAVNQKIAKSYERDITNAIKKVSLGLEDNVALQLKINEGQNVSKELAAKRLNLETQQKVIQEKINQVFGENSDLADKFNKQLGEVLKNTKDTLDDLEKQNTNTQKQISLTGILVKNLTGVADKLDKSGTLSKLLQGNLKDTLTPTRLLELGLALVVNAALEGSDRIATLRQELGVSANEAQNLANELAAAQVNSQSLLVTTRGLLETNKSLNEAFGTAAVFNTETLASATELVKANVLSAEAASQLAGDAARLGVSFEEALQTQENSVNEINAATGAQISLKDVLDASNKISGQIRAQLGANPEAIARAVTQAKALGFELEQIAAAGKQLLDFESSISAELEAELLTGKQLNLERARLAALTGDLETLTSEISANVGDFNDFSKLNVIQQEAIASAVGMTADQLADSLITEENRAQLLADAVASGNEQAVAQLKARSAAQNFQDTLTKIQGIIGDIGVTFAPILDGFASLVGRIAESKTAMVALGAATALFATLSLSAAIANIFKSFAGIPFGAGIPLAFATVAAVIAAVKSASVELQEGGIIPASRGGTLATIGEGGQAEAVVPLDRAGEFGMGGIDYDKMAMAMSKAQVNVTTKYNSFRAYSTTSNGGRYQSSARYESKFV
jgi:hypothetical protein